MHSPASGLGVYYFYVLDSGLLISIAEKTRPGVEPGGSSATAMPPCEWSYIIHVSGAHPVNYTNPLGN